MRTGWIGAGKMGMPICRNLLRAGFPLHVYDVAAEPVRALVADGAIAAADAQTLARDTDVIFSMVPKDEVLLDLVSGSDGLAAVLRPDQIFVDMSTVSPLRSAAVADLLAPTGAGYLRAPVSGSTANAENATLSIFCSGDKARFETIEPLFHHIGNRLSYCGNGEEARVLKLLVNIIVGVTPALLGEALGFGLQSGLDRDMILDAIGTSAGASPVINYKLDMLKRQDWSAMATIDIVAKDLDLALEWARLCGTPMPFTSLAQQTNATYQTNGLGNLDFFAVSEWAAAAVREK